MRHHAGKGLIHILMARCWLKRDYRIALLFLSKLQLYAATEVLGVLRSKEHMDEEKDSTYLLADKTDHAKVTNTIPLERNLPLTTKAASAIPTRKKQSHINIRGRAHFLREMCRVCDNSRIPLLEFHTLMATECY